MRFASRTLLSFPFCLGLFAQDPSALINAHGAWGAKASTPGAVLTLKEISRSGPQLTLQMRATGVPTGVLWTLVAWPVTQRGPQEVLKGISLDPMGIAICAGTSGTCGNPDKPNDPVNLKLNPVPGEPVRLSLISADGTTKVFEKVIPISLSGEDKGCRVEGVLLTSGAELVLIEGAGFQPNSELTMESESEGERQSGKSKASADGKYAGAILPHKQGLTQGSVKVVLKSAKCSPSVSIPWGRR